MVTWFQTNSDDVKVPIADTWTTSNTKQGDLQGLSFGVKILDHRWGHSLGGIILVCETPEQLCRLENVTIADRIKTNVVHIKTMKFQFWLNYSLNMFACVPLHLISSDIASS